MGKQLMIWVMIAIPKDCYTKGFRLVEYRDMVDHQANKIMRGSNYKTYVHTDVLLVEHLHILVIVFLTKLSQD